MRRTSTAGRLPLGLALVLLGAAFCSVSAEGPSAPPEPTFRSDVSEVRMTFSATDENNHVIATIQPGDFAVVDHDIVVRQFRSFSRSEYTRMDVAVLVDSSGSVARKFRQMMATAMQLVTDSNGVPDDCFSLIAFQNVAPTVLCQGNCRALDMGSRFPMVTSGSLTPLYDSIVFAARLLGQRGDLHTRRILLLLSDGADTISLHCLRDALESALENDVTIYSVDVSDGPHLDPGTLVLRMLAADTAGRYFPLESGADQALAAILEDFHAAYTVAYKLPSNAAGFHLVRILPARDLRLHFHCRRGYYYPTSPEN